VISSRNALFVIEFSSMGSFEASATPSLRRGVVSTRKVWRPAKLVFGAACVRT